MKRLAGMARDQMEVGQEQRRIPMEIGARR
jgi:hypothetical protein